MQTEQTTPNHGGVGRLTHRLLPLASCLLLTLLLCCSSAVAQTFTGVNSPGGTKTFSFTLTSGSTNFVANVKGTSSSYSFLYLRKGSAPSGTNYDYGSQFLSLSNYVNLELPQASAGTWYAQLRTPASSASHSFTLNVQKNHPATRTLLPVSKPVAFTNSGAFSRAGWNYFRIESPTNGVSLKISLNTSAANVLFYVQRGRVPTSSSFLKKSNTTNSVIYLSESELTGGAYFIGINSGGVASYTLRSQVIKVTPLTWDPGTADAGTFVSTIQTASGGDSYFKVQTASPSVGAWRTALKVVSGEANLYLSRGSIPSTNVANYISARTGSDGVVLGPKEFTAGESWYFLVKASPNTQFKLVTGAAYVQNLGVLTTNSPSITIGPEGWRFFKTTMPSDMLAWRLSLNGATNRIFLKKTSVPLAYLGGNEVSRQGQLLVVPPYLVGGQLYHVGVQGTPGTAISFDSRRQPITSLNFTSTASAKTTGGYSTFRVAVPTNALSWQIDAAGTNVNLYVRRNSVPNENYNDAYSEAPGRITDSLTLVPPTLSDGTFYITVAGSNTLSFSLTSRNPTVTDIPFIGTITNNETNRVGWRYYRVPNIASQLQPLGWELFLTRFAPNTKIALRRNQVPSVWNARNGATQTTAKNFDYFSLADVLQRPTHQADIWYIGVYNPTNALGPFILTTRALSASTLKSDGGSVSRTNIAGRAWQYFRVDVPSTISGWDLRLTNVIGGSPKIVVRRELLPEPQVTGGIVTTNVISSLSPATVTNWTSGQQWVVGKDWTRRPKSATGDDETGRVLAMGMNRPLRPGTYYVGVYNTGTTPTKFTLNSRFIGKTNQILLRELAFTNGVSTRSLSTRQADYYHIRIPAGSRSWKVKLTVTSGEAMLLVSSNGIPNVESEKRVQKTGNEHYLLLPQYKVTNVLEMTDCYIAVIGEGSNVTTDRIGTGISSYTLQSFGALAEPITGTVTPTNSLSWTGSVEGGETKGYHFNGALGVPGITIYLENRVGNPVMVSRGGTDFPDPGYSSDTYGNEGGVKGPPDRIGASPLKIRASTFPGLDTLMVKARSQNNIFSNASFKVRIEPVTPPLCSGGGSGGGGGGFITNICPQLDDWAYYRFDIPFTAAGWDLRLQNVTKGSPKLAICRGAIPWKLNNDPSDIYKGTNWWMGGLWAAKSDWTGRSYDATGKTNEDGRILTMGVDKPLEAGTYYVAVYGIGSCYTLRSRLIGDGLAIPVNQLAFAGGSFSSNLPPRDVAFFRVKVPAGMRGWKLQLKTANNSEALMAVLQGALPNIACNPAFTIPNSPVATAGRKIQQKGVENFLLLPGKGDTNGFVVPGDYYVAVASEGAGTTNTFSIGTNKTTFTLTSAALQINDLGTLTVPITRSNSLTAGECTAYKFSVPFGTTSIQALLENRIGNPVMVLRSGDSLPDTSIALPKGGSDRYGSEGGETEQSFAGANIINVANPTNGNFFLIVKARSTNATPTNASYTLRITASGPVPLAFSGGRYTVTNQQIGAWNYFRVDVPTNQNLLGWDLRLTNVISGSPRIVVRRDTLPDGLVNKGWGNPGNSTNWASSNQWVAGFDFTHRLFSADGVDETGRILTAGMRHPLEPGTYYVGVANGQASATNAMSYTLMSRGIGSGFSIIVRELAFNNGIVSNLFTPPREPLYFRVQVPAATPSWKMKVTGISGEVMFAGYRGALPCTDFLDSNHTIAQGKSMQKAGNEHYVLLPTGTSNSIPAGSYYFAVGGEGAAITNNNRIGVGNTRFAIHSIGKLPVQNLGTISATSIDRAETLQGGEIKAYQFVVRSNAFAAEIQLENRSGNPIMVFHTNSLPDPGDSFGSINAESYGNEGGSPANNVHQFILTAPNFAGDSAFVTNKIIVKARALNNAFSDAGYTLRVRELFATNLNFGTSGNIASGQLEDNQRAFYKLVVPETQSLGWKLELRQSSGLASVRVRKDSPPTDSPQLGTPYASPAAYIVPPFFTNDTWYVEVKGANSTAYTLTSTPLTLERPAWVMPTGNVNTPGLTLPVFGDTGVSPNGTPLPGDQGIDLEQGYQNYYAVEIPEGNSGLVRFQLQAINGNPDLYIRTNLAPTLSHSPSGSQGTIYNRSLIANGTQYGNWVPLLGSETSLAPGLWYFCVRANGNANARYRVRLTLGAIQNIALNGSRFTNQVLATGDMRYYKFQLPEDVSSWSVNFAQESGDVYLYMRPTVPPGNGASQGEFKHGGTDGLSIKVMDVAGTYSFGSSNSVPGSVHYLGVRAINDASFSVRIFTGNGQLLLSSSTRADAMLKSSFALPQLTQPFVNSAGQFGFTLDGQPGNVYMLEFSTNLIDWMPLGPLTNESTGSLPIIDFGSTNSASRFYRVHSP